MSRKTASVSSGNEEADFMDSLHVTAISPGIEKRYCIVIESKCNSIALIASNSSSILQIVLSAVIDLFFQTWYSFSCFHMERSYRSWLARSNIQCYHSGWENAVRTKWRWSIFCGESNGRILNKTAVSAAQILNQQSTDNFLLSSDTTFILTLVRLLESYSWLPPCD